MRPAPPFTAAVRNLPAEVPFIAPEAIERRLGRPLDLRLGANESAFGMSSLARQAMLEALECVAWYGDPESHELRAELALVHRVRPENLIVGSGIDDLLGLVAKTFIAPGVTAVTSLGAYPTFNYFVAGCSGQLRTVAYRDDRNDLEALADGAARAGARLVYLANPDNPTGTWHAARDLLDFAGRLPADAVLILDEAYAEFAPADALPPVDADSPRVIRLRTFSKAHGMAGARIGYGIAAAETVAAFNKVRVQFGVNRVAQAGALASLKDGDFARRVVGAVAQGRLEYHALAHDLGLGSLPSATNFVAIDMGSFAAARGVCDALLARGVFVRMPGAAPLNRCLRVTVGAPDERTRFAAALREAVAAVSLTRGGATTAAD
jgi:histidinol-phosphate aminotransferase